MTTDERILRLVRRAGRRLKEGQIGKAIELLQEALTQAPDDFDALLTMSAAKILMKKFREAVEILEPLTSGHADNPVVWSNLGAAYLGNPVLAKESSQLKAIAAFTHALEIDPIFPHAAYNIGLIHKDRREYEVALSWFEAALQTNPNDHDASYWILQIRNRLKQEQP